MFGIGTLMKLAQFWKLRVDLPKSIEPSKAILRQEDMEMDDSYQQSTLSGFEESEPKKPLRRRKRRIDELLLGVPKDELKRVSLNLSLIHI